MASVRSWLTAFGDRYTRLKQLKWNILLKNGWRTDCTHCNGWCAQLSMLNIEAHQCGEPCQIVHTHVTIEIVNCGIGVEMAWPRHTTATT